MERPPPMERPVTIGICTSALRSNIEAFIVNVSSLINVTAQFIELPYNDLDSFRLSSKGLDGVIICHSINNRRFAITNVMDALYDVFLPHVRQVFGKNNVCVIAHDFTWPMGSAKVSREDHFRIKGTYMDSFQSKQPTTFECSNLTMICGRLDTQVDMDEEDWTQLGNFVRQCQVQERHGHMKTLAVFAGFGIIVCVGISWYAGYRLIALLRYPTGVTITMLNALLRYPTAVIITMLNALKRYLTGIPITMLNAVKRYLTGIPITMSNALYRCPMSIVMYVVHHTTSWLSWFTMVIPHYGRVIAYYSTTIPNFLTTYFFRLAYQ